MRHDITTASHRTTGQASVLRSRDDAAIEFDDQFGGTYADGRYVTGHADEDFAAIEAASAAARSDDAALAELEAERTIEEADRLMGKAIVAMRELIESQLQPGERCLISRTIRTFPGLDVETEFLVSVGIDGAISGMGWGPTLAHAAKMALESYRARTAA